MSTPTDRDALVAEIAAARARLAATTAELAAKADVPAQAQAAVGATLEQLDEAVRTAVDPRRLLMGGIAASTALAVWLIVRRGS